MAAQIQRFAGRVRLPDKQAAAAVGRGQQLAIRTELGGIDPVGMLTDLVHYLARLGRENPHDAVRSAEGHERRPGTKSDETPADAKSETAKDEATIDRSCRGKRHRRAEQRRRPPARQCEGHRTDRHGAGHNQCERRIPCAGEIEEAQHFCRIHHARNHQPEPEDEPGCERACRGRRAPHGPPAK